MTNDHPARLRRLVRFLLVLFAVYLAGCAQPSANALPPPEAQVRLTNRSASPPPAETPPGLQMRLSEGQAQPVAAAPAAPATAEPLSAAEARAVLDRLPAVAATPADVQDFALPAQSLPPPRPGQTLTESFPPPAPTPGPAPVATGAEVEVLRYAPEGDVPLAPNLSVTFNQPMVALTSLADLAAQGAPVKLSPQPAGKWRWVGTKTLAFEPQAAQGAGAGRFPMATQYTVEIPAGATAANGGKLAKAVTWTFTTPPPQLTASYPPDNAQPLEPLMFAAFDQRIDPAAVLKTITAKAGSAPVTLRLATAEEAQADKAVRRLADDAGAGRWLAFRAVEPLPAATRVTVNVGPGAPSAEGPLVTKTAQGFTFSTYGPLKITNHRCGWGNECPPLTPWYIEFNNALDEAAFDPAQVRVDPELPGVRVQVFGNTLSIQGRSRGRTTYTVRLSGDLRDRFGQTLGRDQAVTFAVGSAQPNLWAPGELLVTLDPSARPAYSVFTINYDRLKVLAYAVGPEDWSAFKTYLQEYNRTDKPPALPGRQILAQTIQVKSRPDEMVETAIDLGPALKNGLGHVIVVIEPATSGLAALLPGRQRPPVIQKWVQATRIGLDATVDGEQMIAWANSLADGKPLPGVKLGLLPGNRSATTDAAGTATLPLPYGPGAELLVATQGNDTAFLPANLYYWGEGGWQQQPRGDTLRWYAFDDRGIYRPGEKVHVKGWIRRVGGGTGGDVAPLAGVVEQVAYRLRDAQGNQILDGVARLTALGGFSMAFTLTETMNLGYTSLELTASGGTGNIEGRQFTHSLQVQEFRRPEFEVKASTDEGPHFVGGGADVQVTASYYAGGGLPNAETTWRVTTQPGQYSPPGWDDFTFGAWVPWWRSGRVSAATSARAIMPGQPMPPGEGGQVETYTGQTDAAGIHRLRLDFQAVNPPEPSVVTAEATIMDVNRQAWTATAALLVHPADLYVGLRSDRLFVQREEPLKIDAIVTDLDGHAVPGVEVRLRAARLGWKLKDGTWQEEEIAAQPCTVPSGKEPVRCTFETPEGGAYRITATVVDDRGRANRTEVTRWVTGGERPPSRNIEQEEVTLIPDKQNYQPGDTAEILVQAPFYPAEGLVTLRRSGIVRSQRFTMDSSTYTLKVPIAEGYIPNIHVQVDLVGAAARTGDAASAPDATPTAKQTDLPKRPAYATGELNLAVPPLARTLALEVTPRDLKLEPGGKTTVDVTVRDAAGQPVPSAELAIAVVDEAVLALTNYDPADPLAVFYAERETGVADHHSRASIVLANPDQLMSEGQIVAQEAMALGAAPVPAAAPAATMAPGARAMAVAKSADAGQPAPAIAVRTDFNPLAAFAPAVPTDAQGHAELEVKLPDNLTRYRVIVIAVAGDKQFGKAESAITARLPLMVRPSPPRFLNFGDRFELPVVIQNQTDMTMTVNVAVQASNAALCQTFEVCETVSMMVNVAVQASNAALCQTFEVCETSKVSATAGRRVTVPANDRVEVRFPVTTVSAGVARFQIAAEAPGAGTEAPPLPSRRGDPSVVAPSVVAPWADAAEFELPVWTPATTEAFAVYGEIDEGAIAQPVIAPTNVFTQFGGLEITTSSTALQALTDAMLYLVAYPFECSEQLASRILAVAALRDVLTAFQAQGLPPAKETDAAVARDIERLRQMQNGDGGWPVWRRGDESWPFHSIHAANALQRAKQKGYTVPPEMLDKAKSYLLNIEHSYPSWYPEDVRRTLTAYALNVRKQMGDADPARARSLIKEAGLDKLSFEAIGWLLPVLSDDPGSKADVEAIRRFLLNRTTETASTAHFVTSYGDNGYLLLHSNRRADGILLDALIGDQPQSDLIPKIVRGLLAQRRAGHWSNTQENVFILLAMDRYFNTYEAQTPDFVARIWLGDQYAGEARFSGRSTDYRQINIPMSYLADKAPGTAQNLIVSKEGPGRLYYRLGLRYAPTDLNLPPYDAGFTVERVYEAVDNPGDVRRDADGAWHIKAGARVRVRLTLVAPARRYHVALVDPLPAGLEALNPALAVTGSLPPEPATSTGGPQGRPYWWWWRTWYEHQNLRDERAEAFTSLLWDGVYTYSYMTRATTPGAFIAPPAKAEEMYAPETFGRSGVDRVVVE